MSFSVIWKFLSAFALTTEDTGDTEQKRRKRRNGFHLLKQRNFIPVILILFSVSPVSSVVKQSGREKPR
jgi:hypothetical protein